MFFDGLVYFINILQMIYEEKKSVHTITSSMIYNIFNLSAKSKYLIKVENIDYTFNKTINWILYNDGSKII